MDDREADAERRAELIRRYGQPEPIAADKALELAKAALIPVEVGVTPDQVHASIYRDKLASDGWLTANKLHYGHPALARFEMADGRVVGILDLRPALATSAERAKEAPPV